MGKKRVLMLNTSHNDLRLILALKQLNFYIISIGGTPGLIGEKYVDEYHRMDYSKMDEVLEFAIKMKIDSICACCNDLGVLTASYVAEKLGLPGHDTYENALIMHHKDRFKQFAREHNLLTPMAKYFSNPTEAINEINSFEYPIIVKPTDLSAGRGVSVANNSVEAEKAINYAFKTSRIKHIVVEPFIDGSQHAFCCFIIDKKVVGFCSNNEYSYVNPYRVEIDTYPATNYLEVKNTLIGQAEKMAQILNLKDGILSMQYRMKDGKPYILEAMRRVLGNLYMIPAERLTGINWDYWEAKAHCGLPLDDFPVKCDTNGFWAYRTIMATKNGLIRDIIIPNHLKKYIFDEYRLMKPGMVVTDYMNQPLSFLFMKFDSREEMEKIILDGYSEVFADIADMLDESD